MTTRPMRVGYVGNFDPPHSTENHLTLALQSHGHVVLQLQENHEATWTTLLDPEPLGLDFLLWTRTWHLPELPQSEALTALDAADVPTVAYHLDRWWGLDREPQVETEPYFGCDLVCTAEGGVPDLWEHAGVRHEWYPPGVLGSLALLGKPNRRWLCDVAFVGSHRSYHVEWSWRGRMTRWLRQQYRGRARLFPQHPSQAIRGEALADVYASAKVIVGDSCLAPYPALDTTGALIPASEAKVPCSRYWSDRVPETIGRGGFLLHPWVEGIEDEFVDGEHLVLVEPEDFRSLQQAIDWWTDDDHAAERDRIRLAGRQHVLEHHTYEQRMGGIVELLIDHGRVAA